MDAAKKAAMDARSSRYHEIYARWQRDPLGFWGEAAADIDWLEKPKKVFDATAGIYGRWFVGGVCNTCFNTVDRHVNAGRGEQTAIIYDSPLARAKRTLTYHRLLTETQVLGGMLRDLGVGKGDRVIIYMPMVPEAVIAMLACARIGAIHSVVFGGFAARELATLRARDTDNIERIKIALNTNDAGRQQTAFAGQDGIARARIYYYASPHIGCCRKRTLPRGASACK